jgi:uncharacterized membrane protein YeaQ/YmgE (transglycosylase-associated protein family)
MFESYSGPCPNTGPARSFGQDKSKKLVIGAKGEHEMSILAWIVLGLVAGFIGSKLVNKTGEGILMDIVLGIVGAVIGGWLFNAFGAGGVSGLNIYSLLVAVVGAVLFLVVYHAIRRVAH